MAALVTGGAGFIGSQLAERLLEEGHEVVVVDNLSLGRRENVPEVAELLNIPCGLVLKAERVSGIDAIFHLGMPSSSSMYRENQGLVVSVLAEFESILRLAKELGCGEVRLSGYR